MSGATAAVLGSVSARTAAGLTQLHSSVSSYIPLKGPLRDQISPGARPPPPARTQQQLHGHPHPALRAGAVQDIALKLTEAFILGRKHRVVHI